MKSSMVVILFPWALIFCAMLLFYLAGDGWYRYPCQEPANFNHSSCHPPDCIASEDCTDMLIDLGDNP